MDKISIALILLLLSISSILPSKKHLEVIFDRTEVVFEIPSILEWHIYSKKINKTRSLVGYLTFYEPIGDNFKLEVKTLKKQGNMLTNCMFV